MSRKIKEKVDERDEKASKDRDITNFNGGIFVSANGVSANTDVTQKI